MECNEHIMRQDFLNRLKRRTWQTALGIKSPVRIAFRFQAFCIHLELSLNDTFGLIWWCKVRVCLLISHSRLPLNINKNK